MDLDSDSDFEFDSDESNYSPSDDETTEEEALAARTANLTVDQRKFLKLQEKYRRLKAQSEEGSRNYYNVSSLYQFGMR